MVKYLSDSSAERYLLKHQSLKGIIKNVVFLSRKVPLRFGGLVELYRCKQITCILLSPHPTKKVEYRGYLFQVGKQFLKQVITYGFILYGSVFGTEILGKSVCAPG